ncbi:putative holin-like toxin [Companilactobacillus kimchiensis]
MSDALQLMLAFGTFIVQPILSNFIEAPHCDFNHSVGKESSCERRH